MEVSFSFTIFAPNKDVNVMKKSKPYPQFDEEDGGEYQSSGSCLTAQEPAVALAEPEVQAIPDDVDDAHIVNGILQVTPDIEEEIDAVDRGERVSMGEFKTMFARWL